ncbi:MAG: DUF6726 family protein [bacterium]|nr:DUF6726 family protein [bacterium]
MKYLKIIFILLIATQLSGCLLTRIVSAPMRAVGGILTIIPVAGDAAHTVIDGAADVVDEVPI